VLPQYSAHSTAADSLAPIDWPWRSCEPRCYAQPCIVWQSFGIVAQAVSAYNVRVLVGCVCEGVYYTQTGYRFTPRVALPM
jgi:hypothetical protein